LRSGRPVVPVLSDRNMDTDELPPVDLAAICASYAPHAVVARLLFIADRFSETVSVPSAGGAQNTSSGSQNHDHAVFPTLALDALKLAHAILKRGDNTALYVSVCERIGGRAGAEYDVDQEMVATKTKRATAKHESLQSDLAGYKTNTIKESIRVGYGDLGDFYRATGAFQDAIKAYARTRDYCTTARHVVSTCLDIARVGVEAENYQHVQNYCAKAAAAVGSGGGGVAGDSATGGGGTPSVASASHCAEPFALAELARAAGLAALEQRKVSNRAFPKSKACLFYLKRVCDCFSVHRPTRDVNHFSCTQKVRARRRQVRGSRELRDRRRRRRRGWGRVG